MKQYGLPHYLTIGNPDRFFMQTRYQADDGTEIFFFVNSHLHNSHQTKISFSNEITSKRNAWVWNPETGERFSISLKDGSLDMDFGPGRIVHYCFRQGKKRAGMETAANKRDKH